MKDRLAELSAEYENKKEAILKEQSNCNHYWDQPLYDPELKKEPAGYKTVAQGSDIYTIPSGYRDVHIPRWSRVCKKCGKIEYTYTQKPIVMTYEPKF